MFSLKTVAVNALLVIVAKPEYFTRENSTSVFNFFKQKYHKKYTSPRDEGDAYGNFIRNLNKVTAFNENLKEKDTIYTLNKYADIDPQELEEHFALNVTSYDANKIYKGPPIRNRHILRSENTPKPEGGDLESIELYDLDDAEDLYKQYLLAFGKKNYSKQYDRTVHFYKFVKSLVDINREHYRGHSGRMIDDQTDTISRPHDYFY